MRRLSLLTRVSAHLRLILVVTGILWSFLSAPVAFGWALNVWTPGDTVDNQGYQPKQPIPFSHKKHAGEKQIPCQYCHASARRSPSAGIPPMNTCMGCHRAIATDKEPIKWLTDKYKKNDPIKWVKVHDVPDYVRFTHKRHVAANLECSECHGPVEEMEEVYQHAPLQMGWCIDCHTKKKAPINCYTCHY